MAKKQNTLPKGIVLLLERGDIEALKKQFLRCEPNATTNKYGSNIFSLSPLPREFAFWAKEQGADVNFTDSYNRTPIFNHASASNGDVSLLLELGAKADVADHYGFTPLHLASQYGRTDAVKALLGAGASVNAKTGRILQPEFATPLEETLQQNRLPYEKLLEICVLLLEHGAEITDRSREFLRKSAEEFQRAKRGSKSPEYLQRQTENLKKLYKLFDVEPTEEMNSHDAISPVHTPKQNNSKAFSQLGENPVPPSGKARSDQLRYQKLVERQMLQEYKPDRSSSLTLVGIVVVFCVLVIAGVSVGVRTLSVGILTFLVALTLGPCIGAVALTVVGYRLVIHGAVLQASYLTNSFLTIGSGFLCMAAGMLLFIVSIMVVFRLLPILWQYAGIFFRNLVEMVRQFGERRGRT